MRKLLLVIFLFLSFHISSYAPIETGIIMIPQSNPINFIDKLKVDYHPLIQAMGIIESKCDTTAVNIKEDAHGYFQIRSGKLEDYNKLTNHNYTLQDMHNYDKSLEVFLYFTNHNRRGKEITPKSFEKTAKNWNGSGPKTEIYWSLVQKQLQLKGHNV
jgi:hypothetical protein